MKEDRLIVALDLINLKKVKHLVNLLSPYITTFKIGWQLFSVGGERIVAAVKEKGEVFLDLKLFDVPFQVSKAVKSLARLEPRFLTISLLGGNQMVKEAVQVTDQLPASKKPFLLGVTILTSLEEGDLKVLGIKGSVERNVLSLAKMAYQVGLKGLVTSPKEARLIKTQVSREMVVVTPGIRSKRDARADQKRVSTVKEALEAGADFLVVGRPITNASDPVKKLYQYLEEIPK